MELKDLIRFFTSKEWRGHKRRIFFQELFEDIKDDRADCVKHENFTFIKCSNLSFEYSCHELASNYDYNPYLDKEYSMNIGKSFGKYHLQTFDSLYAKITRVSPLLKTVIKRKCTFKVIISGRENGRSFNFPYVKEVKL